jgi:hypothetical protein
MHPVADENVRLQMVLKDTKFEWYLSPLRAYQFYGKKNQEGEQKQQDTAKDRIHEIGLWAPINILITYHKFTVPFQLGLKWK